jgi:glycosyltransferase involved in cell wall biosynthesis
LVHVAWFGHVAGKRGNGLISYSHEITRHLTGAGHEVVFFYHGGRETDPQSPYHIRLGSLDLFDRGVISSPNAPRIISENLRERRIDVAHASLSWSLLDFGLPDVCHEVGVPIVCTLHFPYDRRSTIMGNLTRTLYRVYAGTLNKYDRVIIFSQEQKQMLESMGVAESRIVVIPNGVNLAAFSPGPSTLKDELGADTIISFMGRLDPEKNVAALCECFQELDPPGTTRLVIVGTGSEAGRLRRRYRDDERILMTGVIRDLERRVNLLRGTDIYVLPSSVEGLSLAMLEAMACGAATVATDVGSDGEALRGAGLVIDPEHLESQLHLALETLLTYPDFRGVLAQLGRQRVEERYALHNNVAKLVSLYQHILQEA